jgi:hypothetical protein
MGDAEVVGGTNQFDHLALVACRAISRTHAHAAEADGGDFQIAYSQFAFLHSFSSRANGESFAISVGRMHVDPEADALLKILRGTSVHNLTASSLPVAWHHYAFCG